MDELSAKVAIELLEAGIVKFGAFKLKLHDLNPTAPLSPFYINLRIVRSFPRLLDAVTDVYAQLLSSFQFDVLADVPTAVTPIVAVLSYKSGIPMISPRLDEKTHGIANEIDGAYSPGQKVVILDDVITLAESKLRAVEVLEKCGLMVQGIVVLIDRAQGGVEEMRRRGYNCSYAFTINELLACFLEAGKLDQDTYNRCADYLQSQSISK
jgi:uridine monophosphate synthetase